MMSGHPTRGGIGPEAWTDDPRERDDEAIAKDWVGAFGVEVVSDMAQALGLAIELADEDVICDNVSADDLNNAEVKLRIAMLRLLEDIENHA